MSDLGPVRVAIANDYDLVVLGLAAALRPFGELIEVVEVDTNNHPVSDVDVILYDTFAQSPEEPFDVETLKRCGRAAVVVFSWHSESWLQRSNRFEGAAGFIDKHRSVEDIVARIVAIARGQDPAWPGVAGASRTAGQETAYRGWWPGQQQGLSERESQTIALITQGLSNREIAEQAFVSVNTVKTHIRSAYQKMGVVRRSQAVLWGLEHGFEPDRTRLVLER